jgi:hypothetical protein
MLQGKQESSETNSSIYTALAIHIPFPELPPDDLRSSILESEGGVETEFLIVDPVESPF